MAAFHVDPDEDLGFNPYEEYGNAASLVGVLHPAEKVKKEAATQLLAMYSGGSFNESDASRLKLEFHTPLASVSPHQLTVIERFYRLREVAKRQAAVVDSSTFDASELYDVFYNAPPISTLKGPLRSTGNERVDAFLERMRTRITEDASVYTSTEEELRHLGELLRQQPADILKRVGMVAGILDYDPRGGIFSGPNPDETSFMDFDSGLLKVLGATLYLAKQLAVVGVMTATYPAVVGGGVQQAALVVAKVGYESSYGVAAAKAVSTAVLSSPASSFAAAFALTGASMVFADVASNLLFGQSVFALIAKEEFEYFKETSLKFLPSFGVSEEGNLYVQIKVSKEQFIGITTEEDVEKYEAFRTLEEATSGPNFKRVEELVSVADMAAMLDVPYANALIEATFVRNHAIAGTTDVMVYQAPNALLPPIPLAEVMAKINNEVALLDEPSEKVLDDVNSLVDSARQYFDEEDEDAAVTFYCNSTDIDPKTFPHRNYLWTVAATGPYGSSVTSYNTFLRATTGRLMRDTMTEEVQKEPFILRRQIEDSITIDLLNTKPFFEAYEHFWETYNRMPNPAQWLSELLSEVDWAEKYDAAEAFARKHGTDFSEATFKTLAATRTVLQHHLEASDYAAGLMMQPLIKQYRDMQDQPLTINNNEPFLMEAPEEGQAVFDAMDQVWGFSLRGLKLGLQIAGEIQTEITFPEDEDLMQAGEPPVCTGPTYSDRVQGLVEASRARVTKMATEFIEFMESMQVPEELPVPSLKEVPRNFTFVDDQQPSYNKTFLKGVEVPLKINVVEEQPTWYESLVTARDSTLSWLLEFNYNEESIGKKLKSLTFNNNEEEYLNEVSSILIDENLPVSYNFSYVSGLPSALNDSIKLSSDEKEVFHSVAQIVRPFASITKERVAVLVESEELLTRLSGLIDPPKPEISATSAITLSQYNQAFDNFREQSYRVSRGFMDALARNQEMKASAKSITTEPISQQIETMREISPLRSSLFELFDTLAPSLASQPIPQVLSEYFNFQVDDGSLTVNETDDTALPQVLLEQPLPFNVPRSVPASTVANIQGLGGFDGEPLYGTFFDTSSSVNTSVDLGVLASSPGGDPPSGGSETIEIRVPFQSEFPFSFNNTQPTLSFGDTETAVGEQGLSSSSEEGYGGTGLMWWVLATAALIYKFSGRATEESRDTAEAPVYELEEPELPRSLKGRLIRHALEQVVRFGINEPKMRDFVEKVTEANSTTTQSVPNGPRRSATDLASLTRQLTEETSDVTWRPFSAVHLFSELPSIYDGYLRMKQTNRFLSETSYKTNLLFFAFQFPLNIDLVQEWNQRPVLFQHIVRWMKQPHLYDRLLIMSSKWQKLLSEKGPSALMPLRESYESTAQQLFPDGNESRTLSVFTFFVNHYLLSPVEVEDLADVASMSMVSSVEFLETRVLSEEFSRSNIVYRRVLRSLLLTALKEGPEDPDAKGLEILQEIERNTGVQFDPRKVDPVDIRRTVTPTISFDDSSRMIPISQLTAMNPPFSETFVTSSAISQGFLNFISQQFRDWIPVTGPLLTHNSLKRKQLGEAQHRRIVETWSKSNIAAMFRGVQWKQQNVKSLVNSVVKAMDEDGLITDPFYMRHVAKRMRQSASLTCALCMKVDNGAWIREAVDGAFKPVQSLKSLDIWVDSDAWWNWVVIRSVGTLWADFKGFLVELSQQDEDAYETLINKPNFQFLRYTASFPGHTDYSRKSAERAHSDCRTFYSKQSSDAHAAARGAALCTPHSVWVGLSPHFPRVEMDPILDENQTDGGDKAYTGVSVPTLDQMARAFEQNLELDGYDDLERSRTLACVVNELKQNPVLFHVMRKSPVSLSFPVSLETVPPVVPDYEPVSLGPYFLDRIEENATSFLETQMARSYSVIRETQDLSKYVELMSDNPRKMNQTIGYMLAHDEEQAPVLMSLYEFCCDQVLYQKLSDSMETFRPSDKLTQETDKLLSEVSEAPEAFYDIAKLVEQKEKRLPMELLNSEKARDAQLPPTAPHYDCPTNPDGSRKRVENTTIPPDALSKYFRSLIYP